MNETQHDHFVGHLVPGVGFVVLGITLGWIYTIRASILWAKTRQFTIGSIGAITLIISVVMFSLWMNDLRQGNHATKIHRIISLAGTPLGFIMVVDAFKYFMSGNLSRVPDNKVPLMSVKDNPKNDKENIQNWELFVPVYCAINALLYYGHKHPGDEMDMGMPSGEEEAHVPFFISFMFATAFFTLRFIFMNKEAQLFVNQCGCVMITIIGVWYIYVADVLYNNKYGDDGVNYHDAAADFGIITIGVSCLFVILWIAIPNM